MTAKHLSRNTRAPFGRRQEGPARDATVGSAVTATEKNKILHALEVFGFQGQSDGVRGVMLAFVTSKEVRAAVLAASAGERRQSERRKAS